MLPSISNSNLLYKAAIALNNTAVTLLERQQYKEAVDTFRRSTSAIHAVVEETRNPIATVDDESSALLNETNRHLQEASQRCAQSYIATDTTRQESSNNVHVVKISSQQSATSVLDAIASHGGATQVYTCVVIEPAHQDESYEESIGEVCNSIIYNFGVVHCILASQFNASVKSDQILIEELRQRAFKLFRIIEPFFLAKLVCCPNEFHERGVVLLCVLFAQAISTVARHLHYTTLWENYNYTLRVILDSIDAQEMLIPTMNQHAAVA